MNSDSVAVCSSDLRWTVSDGHLLRTFMSRDSDVESNASRAP